MKKIDKMISILCVLIVGMTFTSCATATNKNDSNVNNGDYTSGKQETDRSPFSVQDGFVTAGNDSEPTTPFWCAYSMMPSYDTATDYEMQLSFGTEDWVIRDGGWENCDKIVVCVTNNKSESYVSEASYIFEELTTEAFFTEKYSVKIDYTYKQFEKNGEIFQEVDKEIFTFSHTQTYQISADICEYDIGRLDFSILAYAQDHVVGLGCQTVYYRKDGNKINFMTIRDYYESKEQGKI